MSAFAAVPAVAAAAAVVTLAVSMPVGRRPVLDGAAPPAARRATTRRRLVGITASSAATLVGFGPAALLGVVATACAAAVARRRRRRRQHERALHAGYPHALDLLALSMRAGFSTAAAARLLAGSGPPALRRAFATMVRRIDRGERVGDAAAALADEIGPVAIPLSRALADAERSGLPLGPVLDRLEDEARQQRRRDAESAARRLPVRLTFPLVLCMLPSFVLLAVAPLLATAFSELRVVDA